MCSRVLYEGFLYARPFRNSYKLEQFLQSQTTWIKPRRWRVEGAGVCLPLIGRAGDQDDTWLLDQPQICFCLLSLKERRHIYTNMSTYVLIFHLQEALGSFFYVWTPWQGETEAQKKSYNLKQHAMICKAHKALFNSLPNIETISNV